MLELIITLNIFSGIFVLAYVGYAILNIIYYKKTRPGMGVMQILRRL